ncbi:MAG: helix-turn-helix domain-containing protein [Pirellula sp.]
MNKSLGSKIKQRLESFAEKLETVSNLDELQETLTVRKVVLNLSPQPFSAEEIKSIRNQLRLSQAIFAEFMGVAVSTVQDWEQGINEASGPARRVLEEMCRDMDSWRKRIRDMAVSK